MRKIYIFILLNLALIPVFGKQVEKEVAEKVARTFLNNVSVKPNFPGTVNLHLLDIQDNTYKVDALNSARLFYVFNINNDNGFIIIAADDRVKPILAYSFNNAFDENNMPPNLKEWLESARSEISYIYENIPESVYYDRAWNDLKNNKKSSSVETAVSPLVSTTWGQGNYYNDLCPYDETAGQNCVTGCVATALAQIMKFWNHPTQGTGSHTWNYGSYGDMFADFGNTTYDWGNMPESVSSENNAVATLMYHCGIAVDMMYGPYSSGAYSYKVVNAIQDYFKYQNTVHQIYRSSYTEENWMNEIRAELNAGRPIYYTGRGPAGGHAFVCDGFDNDNNCHINWGWDGYYNGYFALGAFNPGSTTFNDSQTMIIGIEPLGGSGEPDLIASSVSFSPASAGEGSTLNVFVTVKNTGTASAGESRLKYYLSTDATITASDFYLGDDVVSSLNPGSSSAESISFAVTSGLSNGYYYVGCIVDANTEVAESNEDNAFYAGSLFQKTTGSSEEDPDLVVNTIDFDPLSGTIGSTLNISVNVFNRGGSIHENSKLEYYLSTDQNITPDDFYVGYDLLGALNGGTSGEENISWRVPSNLETGNYYVGCLLDVDDVIHESDENNGFCNTEQLYAHSGGSSGDPDLIASAISFSPESGNVGTNLSIDVVVKNIGEGKAGSSSLHYYLSKDENITTADRYLGSDLVLNLDQNETSNESIVYTIPNTLSDGVYFVGCIVDADGEVAETDEQNGFYDHSGTFTMGNGNADKPDLSAANLSFTPASAENGQSLNYSAQVHNVGQEAAGSSMVKFYLSSDQQLDESDFLLGSQSLDPIDAQTSVNIDKTWNVTAALAPGQYYFGCVVDVNNEVDESDEENAFVKTTTSFTKTGSSSDNPDLIVSSIAFSPESGDNGTGISIEIIVQNAGTKSAATSNLNYYLSTDNQIDQDDYYIGNEYIPALDPGEQTTETHYYRVPSSLPDNEYYVGCLADVNDNVTESDENNAFFSSQGVFVKGNGGETGDPDLVASFISFSPSEAAPGGDLFVDVTVKNIGEGAAGSSIIDYYISTDTEITPDDLFMGRDFVQALPIDHTTDVSINWRIPGNLEDGKYYVGCIVDAQENVSESDEDNAFYETTGQLTIGEGGEETKADLIAINITFSPEKGNPKDILSISLTVKNAGGTHCNPSYVAYYLSEDDEITEEDIYIGQDYVGGLSPNRTSRESISWYIPDDIEKGDYYVGCITDYGDYVDEEDEANGFVSEQGTFTLGNGGGGGGETLGPDLVATDMKFNPATIEDKYSLNIWVTVINAGDEFAPSNYMHYYLSKDTVITKEDFYLGRDFIPNLYEGWSTDEKTSWMVSSDLEDGEYYVGVLLDVDDVVEETDEYNSFVIKDEKVLKVSDQEGSFIMPLNALISDCLIFPNPFSDFTTIRFMANTNENIRIEIFDFRGNKINDILSRGGIRESKQVSVSAENLKAGIYYCRISVHGVPQLSKKLIKY